MSVQTVTAAERAVLDHITPKKGFGLVQKLGATICLLLIFAVALSGLLNFFNFEKNYESMVRSRYGVLLRDLGHTVDYGLGLGLSLGAMDNIPGLISQAKASDPAIQFIKVFDRQGQVLFDTDPAGVGKPVAEKWTAAVARGGEEWSLQERDSYLVGLPLRNSFNELEGALVLGFAKTEVTGAVNSVLFKLLELSALVIGLFAAASVLLVMLITRGLVTSLRSMDRTLERVLGGELPESQAAQSDRPLEREFDEFQFAVAKALADATPRTDAPQTPTEPAERV